MTIITIKEQGTAVAEHVVSIDGQEYPFTLVDPFTEQDEQLLEWYFEQYIKFPFIGKIKANKAAASITTYGHALFDQIFGDRRAFARYKAARQQGVETLSFEVVGSPEFQHMHWEALKDPELPQPFVLQASFVRRNFQPQAILAELRPAPIINLLVISARPHGARGPAYRTITRPLVHALRQANLRVQVDIVRPGTYAALEQQLEAVQDRHGAGYYHIVHFDVHGRQLPYSDFLNAIQGPETNSLAAPIYQARYGRHDLPPYDGVKAFVVLESGQEGKPDLVEGSELARLLLQHQVPIAILDASKSGKQVGAQETSLGSQLLQGGVQIVLAVSYSVTTTASELLMQRLYKQLFGGADFALAIRAARLELFNHKGRLSYRTPVDLEDWLLPVVYQNQPQQFTPREFTFEEEKNFYRRQKTRYREPRVSYAFVGRDLDVLNMERRLLADRNIMLVRGMGGSGKTTLLHHLGYWWQTTGLVDQVFYFGYDQKPWTRQQVMHTVAKQLLGEIEYRRRFQLLEPDAQQIFLAERLRGGAVDGKRHLLILDNLESITGGRLAIQNELSEREQNKLHGFLQDLAGGRTLVLLGSRGGEGWLAYGTFGDNVYELPGLDPEAASNLADLILQRNKATKWRDDKDFTRLLRLLDGYPLPLEIVLANLQTQTPTEIVEALEAGLKDIDTSKISKTESLLACVDYSYGNLAEDIRQLLLCLAPFTGVVSVGRLEQYTGQLKAQAALAHLPLDRWGEVLAEAANWGLLSPHNEAQGYLRLQPILPYFLRNRLQVLPEFCAAVETAFREVYNDFGAQLQQFINSKDPQQRHLGIALVSLEAENLGTALELALRKRVDFFNPYDALYRFLDAQSSHMQALQLSEQVLTARSGYTPAELTNAVSLHFYVALEHMANSALMTKQYARAERTYQQALEYSRELRGIAAETHAYYTAGAYHQLGRVAEEQRQWVQAELYYQQALAIFIDLNNRYNQAGAYHQLGIVAEAQQQWAQAEQLFHQALAIFIELNDRYNQARTYHQLGIVAEGKRQWAQAEQLYHQALAVFIEFDDLQSQAAAYHQLGRVAQAQQMWTEAEQYYQQALAIFINLNDGYSQARIYHSLGMVIQERHQLTQAEQYFQQALVVYIELNDRYEQGRTYYQLGRVARKLRQWTQAKQYFQQALVLHMDVNDRDEQANTYHQLGMVAGEQRQWTQAEQFYQQALAIFIDSGDLYGQAAAYHQLGRVVGEQGQWGQAEKYCQQALGIYIEFSHHYEQGSTYGQLGILAQMEQQWAQSKEYLVQALAIFLKFNDEHNIAITMGLLARLSQESNDASLLTEVAQYFNTTPEQLATRFRQALAADDQPS